MANTAEIELKLIDRITADYRKVAREIEKRNKQMGTSIKKMGEEGVKSDAKIKKLNNQLKKSASQLKKTGKSADTAASSMKKYLGAFLGIAAATKAFRSLIDTELSLTQINNALIVGTGSAEAAAVEFKFLDTEARRLGLAIESSALSFARLTAATAGTVLEGQATREIFLGVAEASAALGLSADQANGALLAFQQIASKGTVQAEELRGQLGERIPGAFKLAAKAMKVTERELNKMLETGKVTANEFLPLMAAEMRKTFGPQASKGPEQLAGKINALKNSMFDLQKQFLAEGGGDLLKMFFEKAAAGVKFLQENMDDIISVGKTFFIVFAAAKIIKIGLAIKNMVLGFTALNPALVTLAAGLLAIDVITKQLEKGATRNKTLFDIYGDPERLKKLIAFKEEFQRLNETTNLNGKGLQFMDQTMGGVTTQFDELNKRAKDSIGIGLQNNEVRNIEISRLKGILAGLEKINVAKEKEKVKKLSKPEVVGETAAEKAAREKQRAKDLENARKVQTDLIAINLEGADKRIFILENEFAKKKAILVKAKKDTVLLEETLVDQIALIRADELQKATDIQDQAFLASLSAADREVEVLIEKFAREKEILTSHKQDTFLLEQNLIDQVKVIRDAEHQDKLDKMDEEKAKARETAFAVAASAIGGVNQTIGAFGSLASVRSQNAVKAAEEAGKSEAEINRIRKHSFQEQKKFQIASAIGNIALGITNAIARGGILGLVEGAFITAAGAVQIASIQAQKFASGGFVGTGQATGDRTPALLNRGEMVLNTGQQRNLLGLANGGGGSGNVTAHFGNITIHAPGGDPDAIFDAVIKTQQEQQREFSEFKRENEFLRVTA